MKGVELPINVLVIVAIAIVVLLGLVGLFLAGFLGGSTTFTVAQAKNNACAQLVQRGCATTSTLDVPAGYDVDGNGVITFNSSATGENLQYFCQQKFGVAANNTLACKRNICTCPV